MKNFIPENYDDIFGDVKSDLAGKQPVPTTGFPLYTNDVYDDYE